ncbi:MAG TPA: polysaccharide deacetylase family protein [Candidatus Saccharimonadales bacterium]|nr:polysaccharide deacetylase family protein [Candidatus Saccharimonadales bacterium]
MFERRINKRLLGAAAAIAAGNLAVPAAGAVTNEHEAALAAKRVAITKVGGHAVKSASSAIVSKAHHKRHYRSSGGTAAVRLPTGCTSPGGTTVTTGPHYPRRVALTFDDGPSVKNTPKILNILNHFGVHGTFFEEGKHVRGREELMTEILASGDEIGNHSYHHPQDPGYGELVQTNHRIQEATGFKPCLFRPPYGLVNSNVSSAASRLGLEIVEWSVDSLDDKHPGVSAIRSNVLSQAEPGSVILMHDGGHHPQTVRALPGIIRGLKDQGFGFATVTELTGGHCTYK